MQLLRALLALIAVLTASPAFAAADARSSAEAQARPTIVLVHGAFAESASWNGVVARLEANGYRVIAAPNPLRSVQSDAASIAALVRTIPGDVVLVGHSYGGPVISTAAAGLPNVRALVFVSAFAPDVGESATALSGRFPGSTLGETLQQVPFEGGVDLYVDPARYHAQFAGDVPANEASLMAATQRPVTQAALDEPAQTQSWRTLPNWWIYGSADRNIPPAVMAFMARRANARHVEVIDGASHSVMVSHPAEVAATIGAAAGGR